MNLGPGIKVDSDGYVSGTTPWVAKRPSNRPIKTYPVDRRCECGARLSRYNEDTVCAPCSPERWAEH